jgi:hypothetical protein
MWVLWGATVTLSNCLFTRNEYDLAVAASRADIPSGEPQDTIVRLMNCTFEYSGLDYPVYANQGTEIAPEYSTLIYSDGNHEIFQTDGESKSPRLAEPLEEAPAGRDGINSTTGWFKMVQEVRSYNILTVHTLNTVTDREVYVIKSVAVSNVMALLLELMRVGIKATIAVVKHYCFC